MIRGWLSEGKAVIVDRYVYSNVGYQCAKFKSEEERAALQEWIMRTEYEEFAIPEPDLSIFLDVPFAFTERKLREQREGDDRSYLLAGIVGSFLGNGNIVRMRFTKNAPIFNTAVTTKIAAPKIHSPTPIAFVNVRTGRCFFILFSTIPFTP